MRNKEDKAIAAAEKAEKKRTEQVAQRRKELQRKKKQMAKKQLRLAAKQKKKDEEAKRAIWIQSTQGCTHIQDIINGVVVTSDKRYLKIIEVVPQNFNMLSVRKQNAIGDSFGGLLNVIPHRVQLKCFSRKGDVEELIEVMRRNMSQETNPICREMQEDYLRLIRNTAHTVGVKRRFFIVLEHEDSAMANGTDFHDIIYSLESYASMLRTRLLECGNAVLDTGDHDESINAIFYELLNRKKAETVMFRDHSTRVFENYELESIKLAEEGKPPQALIAANEFVAPQWMDFKHAHYCVVDNKFYAFYYLDSEGYPQPAAITGWLNFFVNFCEGVDVDVFVDRIPQDKVREKVARQQRFNVTKRSNTENIDSYDMESRVASGSYIMQAMAASQEYFEVSILITVCSDTLTELQYNEDSLIKAAKAHNFKLRPCLFQQEQAFYSALPLCNLFKGIRSKSWHNMMTEGVASLYPFLSFELQDPKGIMLGTNAWNNSLVSLDLFDTSRHVNANVAIMGKSGYGKTFTAQLLAVRERLQGIQVFIITPLKGREDYKRTCDKIQGQYLAMGPGTPYHINIFDITAPDESVIDDDTVLTKSLLAQKVQSLHTFLHLICKDITYEEEMRMDGYFYQAYYNKGITDDNNSIYIPGTRKYKEMPLLGDVYDIIKDEPGMTRIMHILTPYVSGAHKEFNCPTNVDLSNLYICFDMDGLNGDDLALGLFVALDYVWRKIKENKAVKKSVFIDEIWKLIGIEGNDMAAQYCVEIFKTIRAYGGSAVSMTQEVTDFFKLKNGAYGKGIISAADTKICLRLDEGELDRLQDVMELSEAELEQIPRLQRGTGLLVTGNARVEVRFTASEKEKYVISTDPEIARKEQAERLARLQALKNLQENNAQASTENGSTESTEERPES